MHFAEVEEMASVAVLDIDRELSLLNTSEAAALLHVHPNTLRRWSDLGLLASYRINPRGDRRFLRDEVLRFLNEYSAFR